MQPGDHAGAVSCLDRGTRMDLNSNTAACLYAGSALQRLDRHAESIIRFDRAIRPEPQHADGYILKGKSLAKLGGRNGAISCLDRAIRLEPSYADTDRGEWDWTPAGLTWTGHDTRCPRLDAAARPFGDACQRCPPGKPGPFCIIKTPPPPAFPVGPRGAGICMRHAGYEKAPFPHPQASGRKRQPVFGADSLPGKEWSPFARKGSQTEPATPDMPR